MAFQFTISAFQNEKCSHGIAINPVATIFKYLKSVVKILLSNIDKIDRALYNEIKLRLGGQNNVGNKAR